MVGFGILRLPKGLTLLEQIVWSAPVGLAVLTLAIFSVALVAPTQNIAIGLTCILMSLTLAYVGSLNRHLANLKTDWQSWRKTSQLNDWLALGAVGLPFLFYAMMTIPFLLIYKEGNLIAGWVNIWGDWAVHLRTSTFLATGDRLSLESPLYAGEIFRYPYLASYLSAILQRLGLDSVSSLIWPTMILFCLLPVQLYLFGRRLTESRLAGVLMSYIFLLAGGGGLYYLIRDLAAGRYFWQASPHSPLVYTDWGRVGGLSTNDGIWFMNFIMSELLPQRAFLAGLGIALLVLMITVTELKAPKPNRPALLLAGCLFGILPLIHSHSFIALGLIVPTLIFIEFSSRLRASNRDIIIKYLFDWLALLGPATVVGFGLFFAFLYDPDSTGQFIKIINGWRPEPDKPFNWLKYWLINAGPLIVIGLTAWRWPNFRPSLFAGGLVWLVGNFISFQPWTYDNLKILTYWYLLWSGPVAVVLVKLGQRSKLGAGLSIIFFIMLTGAGTADTLTVTASTHNGGLPMANKEGLEFARQVKEQTSTDDLILAATNHNHPLSLASGRRLYMGYEGWLWTYGLTYAERLAEMEKMYLGEPEGLALIKAANISHLVIGEDERRKFKVNEEALTTKFETVISEGAYRLLKVRTHAQNSIFSR